MYAHSLKGLPVDEWEKLPDHLNAVGSRAAHFASVFGWAEVARAAGLLHDIGKCSAEFGSYIERSSAGEEGLRGPDHSTAGARAAETTYPFPFGRFLSHIIAGHHAGLSDWEKLGRRLTADYRIASYAGWEKMIPLLPTSIAPNVRFREGADAGFTRAFLIRMLFSCLVDADFLETERFYAKARGEPIDHGGYLHLEVLRDRLRSYMANMLAEAVKNGLAQLNSLRADVLKHAVGKAGSKPGLFTLTVPTGGGKTLASLSFALEHAVEHGLDRIVYVIPYTSIIEQTADVFRTALVTNEILEHHASFDWERVDEPGGADDEGADGLKKLQIAAENWDVPIVVTTAVQFYGSLFANRTSRCRKLHNLAKSVIVLDEAQMMPLKLLLPSMAAVWELSTNYGASVVLCTATQPALRAQDGFKGGFDIPDVRELAPEPKRLYAELKRFDIEWKPDPVGDDEIATRFAERPQMLAVVNTRVHAKALFSGINDMEGACHLSTLMCPLHRRAVLAKIKTRLRNNKPVRLVSTSLIECGIDIDFPEVWRAASGLDTIIQAGGRCNREGGPVLGRVVVFVPAAGLHKDIETFWQAARPVLRRFADNPNDLDPIRSYFREVYWHRGREALDAAKVGDRPGILKAISERADELTFPFASIADAFEMIDDYKEPVIVPWRSGGADREAERLLATIASKPRPFASDFRRLQQYTVTIPPQIRGQWLALGVLIPVHAAIGDDLLKFADLSRYNPKTGLDLESPEVLPTARLQI